MRADLDATDWRILKELQADGRLTNVALANRIGLSAAACLRRTRALEQSGLIRGYHAVVDGPLAGFEVTAFVSIRLHSQAEADLRAFENRIQAWPLVREAYILSGETDFLLKCVAADLPAFQEFILGRLTGERNVASVRTTLVMRVAKLEAGVPIPLPAAR